MSKNTKKPRIQLDSELIADLEAEDTQGVKGGQSGASAGSRVRSGSQATSGASMT